MKKPTERMDEHATGRSIRPIGPLCRPSPSEWVSGLATVAS